MAILGGKGTVGTLTGLSGGTSSSLGRPFVDTEYPITTSGTLESFDVRQTSGAPEVRLKVFRDVGATRQFIGQSQVVFLTAGLNTVTLDTPIEVLSGDLLCVWIKGAPSSAPQIGATAGGTNALKWVTAGVPDDTSDRPVADWASAISFNLALTAYGTPGGGGGGDTITLNAQPVAAIINPTSSNIEIALSGTYTGTPTSIRRQIHYADNDAVVAGFEWATYIASPAGDIFSGATITLPRSTRGYYAAVDFSNDALVTDTTNSFICAYKQAVIGESLARDMETDGTLTPSAGVYFMDRNTGALSIPSAGQGNIAKANALTAHTGYGTAVCTYGSGGMALLFVNNNGNYLYNASTPTANYNECLKTFTAGGQPPLSTTFLLGANDAFYANSTPAEYQAALGAFFAQYRADTAAGHPIYASLTGVHLAAPDALKYGQHVMAQKAAYDDPANAISYVAHYDVPLQDDVHPSGAGYAIIGQRIANAIIDEQLGGAVAWELPQIVSAQQTSPTTTLFTTASGDVSGNTGVSGFLLSADGTNYTVAISDVSATGANTLVTTHASAAVTNYRFMFGSVPDRSVYTLSGTLPLVQSVGAVTAFVPVTLDIVISGIPDGTYTVNLCNYSTGAQIQQASLTFAGGSCTVVLPVANGTAIAGYIVDLPSNGAVIYGVASDGT
jgi:hypothetical protein